MSISERAIGSALGWPTPLACLYSLAMETGIGIRDYWHEDTGIAAIVVQLLKGQRERAPGRVAAGAVV